MPVASRAGPGAAATLGRDGRPVRASLDGLLRGEARLGGAKFVVQLEASRAESGDFPRRRPAGRRFEHPSHLQENCRTEPTAMRLQVRQQRRHFTAATDRRRVHPAPDELRIDPLRLRQGTDLRLPRGREFRGFIPLRPPETDLGEADVVGERIHPRLSGHSAQALEQLPPLELDQQFGEPLQRRLIPAEQVHDLLSHRLRQCHAAEFLPRAERDEIRLDGFRLRHAELPERGLDGTGVAHHAGQLQFDAGLAAPGPGRAAPGRVKRPRLVEPAELRERGHVPAQPLACERPIRQRWFRFQRRQRLRRTAEFDQAGDALVHRAGPQVRGQRGAPVG